MSNMEAFNKIMSEIGNQLTEETITAIKAALEAKDEPVGWAEHGVINWLADKQFNHTSFLYSTPSQRTWVGLTDEHKEGLICMTDPNPEPHHLRELIDVVEFQLKEKNT
jgi:hypothetical protein